QTVIVNVRGDHAPDLSQEIGNARFLTYVSKSAIAIVMKEPTWHREIDFRYAVVAATILMYSAGFVQFLAEIHKSPDKEVQSAIIVIVEPDCARRPPRRTHPRLFGDIGKGPVPVVVVQNVASVLCDVKVGKAIAVIVAHRHALTVAAACDTGLFGDIGKCPVAIIVVERVSQVWIR